MKDVDLARGSSCITARVGHRHLWQTLGTWGARRSKKSLRCRVEAGGNFIDTTDSYQFGESEEIVGEFIVLAKGKDERPSHRRL